ncbi:MAG: alpha/beta hydrolase [Acidobacteria bacterium]|nr:alpha/beta hydrolase [Acidobacteriota bacterium]
MSIRLLAFCLATALVVAAIPSMAQKGPWKDQRLKVGDLRVHYIEAGAGDRTLVFIPGWTMIAEVWREQIPYFAARGFRVIAIDPRSHGQTTRTDDGNTYEQQAADLLAFLRELRIERPILVGWSAGVSVLLEYLAGSEMRLPQKLVLVDGGVLGHKKDDYPGGSTIEEFRSRVLAFQDSRAKFTEQFVKSMFKVPQSQLLIQEITRAALAIPAGSVVSLYVDLFTGDRRPLLARVRVPTLIVMAEDHRLIGEYLQSKISGSRLEVIEGAGHAVFLDKPQAFNQVLEDFLGAN